jgi:preprotein translocase subunit SecD
MERSWYWRVALIVIIALWSVWQLVPSYYYFKLPVDQRNGAEYEQSVPRWAPTAKDQKNRLNLGLDLQGGVLLAMGVDVDRAVQTKITRRADEIAAYLRGKSVAFDSSQATADRRQVEVKAKDLNAVRSAVLDSYGQEMVSSGADGAVRFAFKERVLKDYQDKAVTQAEKVIRNRVDKWGVSEPDIKRKANNQIQIQLPGFKDPDKAKELLGRTAQLEFKIVDDESGALAALATSGKVPVCKAVPGSRGTLVLPLPDGGCLTQEGNQPVIHANKREELEKLVKEHATPLLDPEKNVVMAGEEVVKDGVVTRSYWRSYLVRAKTELTGDYVEDAGVAQDQGDKLNKNGWVVTFKMTAQGAKLMQKLTSENVHKRMATILDDKVETAPTIQSTISDRGQITLGSGRSNAEQLEEAKNIAVVLQSGALPAPVVPAEERTVGATLGPELVRKGTQAALIGLAAVLIFMVLYYRASGLIADFALALNGLLVLAVMSVIGTTLTLPGIAGFVLTLGMAVDANVLINERIREEMRNGRTVKQSVQQGYDRVFWTIVDSHVTTLVAGVVLMSYGSGPVRGFAVALIIGLLASLFTSIVVTRVLMEYFTRHETARLSV